MDQSIQEDSDFYTKSIKVVDIFITVTVKFNLVFTEFLKIS